MTSSIDVTSESVRSLKMLTAQCFQQCQNETKISPEIKKMVRLQLHGLTKRARSYAEEEYERYAREREKSGVSCPPRTASETKKHMRNRSAFISRQTGKRYEKMLEAHVRITEQARNDNLYECVKQKVENELLRVEEQRLRAQLRKLSTPSYGTASAWGEVDNDSKSTVGTSVTNDTQAEDGYSETVQRCTSIYSSAPLKMHCETLPSRDSFLTVESNNNYSFILDDAMDFKSNAGFIQPNNRI